MTPRCGHVTKRGLSEDLGERIFQNAVMVRSKGTQEHGPRREPFHRVGPRPQIVEEIAGHTPGNQTFDAGGPATSA